MLPQLDFSHYTSQLFWLLVCCIVLVVAVKRVFIPRMNAIIQRRDEAISRDESEMAELEQRVSELRQNVIRIREGVVNDERAKMAELAQRKEKMLSEQLRNIKREHDDVMRQHKMQCDAEMAKIKGESQTIDTLVQIAIARLRGHYKWN